LHSGAHNAENLMLRKLLLAGALALTVAGSPAAAQNVENVQELIVAQLADQGFSRVRISKTLLGRVRIFATSADYSREIIINPRTGEILRDYWTDLAEARARTLISPDHRGDDNASGPGPAKQDDDDHDDDDDDHDDDDDDDDDGKDDNGKDDNGKDDDSGDDD
jgi:hypothetical protein